MVAWPGQKEKVLLDTRQAFMNGVGTAHLLNGVNPYETVGPYRTPYG